MRYACLVYLDEKSLDDLSEQDRKTLDDESMGYDDVLRRSGHLVVAHALRRSATATTVRVRDGRVLTTDGPFTETKEQLVGFLLIEARDSDEAIALASRVPLARAGSIEVRPVAIRPAERSPT